MLYGHFMPVCQFAGKKNAKNWTINHRNVSPKTNGTFEINDKEQLKDIYAFKLE